MFPGSDIAQKLNVDPQKLSYIIIFGLVPYFKKLLLAEIQEAAYFVVSVDESLKQELQQEQMDFIVKYFREGR